MDSDWPILGHVPIPEPIIVVEELERFGFTMPGSGLEERPSLPWASRTEMSEG